jgi:hypothetical protein
MQSKKLIKRDYKWCHSTPNYMIRTQKCIINEFLLTLQKGDQLSPTLMIKG